MDSVSKHIFTKSKINSSSSGGVRSSNDDNSSKYVKKTACVGGTSSWWDGQQDRQDHKIFIKEESLELGFPCVGSHSFPNAATNYHTILPPPFEPQDLQRQNYQYYPFAPLDPVFPLFSPMEYGIRVGPSSTAFFEGSYTEMDLNAETVGTGGAGSSAGVSSSSGNAVEKSCLLAIALADGRQPGASITKAAHSKRRLARQKWTGFSHFSRPSSAAALCLSSNRLGKKSATSKLVISHPMPENKGMKLLVQKQLSNSDVCPHGRVVLPKRDSEDNLPYLTAKEGIEIALMDLDTSKIWNMRYRFWPNNNSRMYVLENTGAFVKQHGLRNGDYITLYKDEFNQLFISAWKIERQSSGRTRVFGVGEPNQKLTIDVEEMADDDNNDLALSLSNQPRPFKGEQGSSSNQKNKGVMMTEVGDEYFGRGIKPTLNDFYYYNFGQLATPSSKFDECELSLYDDAVEKVVGKGEVKPADTLPQDVVNAIRGEAGGQSDGKH